MLRRAGRSDAYAAAIAEAAKQLTFLANLDRTLCTREAAKEAVKLDQATRMPIGSIIAQLALEQVKVRARVERIGGRLIALYPTACPRCHAELETTIERAPPEGRCRMGLLVQSRCPACGWSLRYRLCVAECGRPLGLALKREDLMKA
jgi:hypothetical protein